MLAQLLNHLWQSTALAALAAVLAFGLRRHQARVRFWVWSAASLKFLVPFGAVAALGGLVRWPYAPTAVAPVLNDLSQPFSVLAVAPAPAPQAPAAAAPSLLPWMLLGVWAAGCAVVLLHYAVQWRRLARVARQAVPEKLSRGESSLKIRVSAAAIEPGLFGIVRPVLLLPAGIRERLTAAQLEAVVAHESCHARRRDNLWSALHMTVEALFWFHPLVWWMGARLVAEREQACDEEVLRRGGDPEAYAGGILAVCRYYVASPLACAAGITGADLKRRVAAIMGGGWGRNLSLTGRVLLGLAAVGIVAAPLAAGIVYGQGAAPAARLEFDAVSIKANLSGSGSSHSRGDQGRLTMTNVPLHQIIAAAYGLQSYQIDGPGWLDSARFDIVATTESAVPRNQIEALLQPVLEKRFQLIAHRETKQLPVFALVVDKSGSKNLIPTSVNSGADMDAGPAGAHLAASCDMARFANYLARQTGRPVLDQTGLAGAYKFTLDFTPERTHAAEGAAGAAAEPSPTLFTALQEQLGLRLRAEKGPVEVLVIDHIEKTPTAN